jgi:hypothetical protein
MKAAPKSEGPGYHPEAHAEQQITNSSNCATDKAVDALRDGVDALRGDLAFRLGAMLKAATALANHQRVHGAVEAAAEALPEFERTISRFCPSWRDPGADYDCDALHELLIAACWELDALVARAAELSKPAARGSQA